jgi:hypothetical protein
LQIEGRLVMGEMGSQVGALKVVNAVGEVGSMWRMSNHPGKHSQISETPSLACVRLENQDRRPKIPGQKVGN